eukprot:TRINITY_DN10104_c0_g1_i1.p1 TRINITY_DN10104_c0_g1~~TRINITY_DN10104_c0_g1_i1.p1  ORF type:complete len:316 (+),score=98.68 TRINITY_DN10104_c0_g1_i1:71-949(+)
MASHLGPEFDSSDESSLSGSGSGTQTPIAARPGARFDFTPPAPRAFHGHHVPDGDHQQQPEGLLTTADPDAANPQSGAGEGLGSGGGNGRGRLFPRALPAVSLEPAPSTLIQLPGMPPERGGTGLVPHKRRVQAYVIFVLVFSGYLFVGGALNVLFFLRARYLIGFGVTAGLFGAGVGVTGVLGYRNGLRGRWLTRYTWLVAGLAAVSCIVVIVFEILLATGKMPAPCPIEMQENAEDAGTDCDSGWNSLQLIIGLSIWSISLILAYLNVRRYLRALIDHRTETQAGNFDQI